jgi:nicotinamide mononucleotide transporter
MKTWHVLLATILFGIIGYFTSSSTIEIVSAVSGLLCVWLAARENVWTYPIGLINIAAFMYIFFDAKLYADFTLQIVFAILSVMGWVVWLTKRQGKYIRPTTSLDFQGWTCITISVFIITLIWGSILKTYTDASIPYLDAFIATLSIVAQWLLSKKILQNWYLWIAVDVLSIGMYFYKDLTLIGILYIVFLFNAIYGLYQWRNNYEKA